MIVVLLLALYHIALMGAWGYIIFCWENEWIAEYQIWFEMSFLGLVGCCVYCLRSLYEQFCVKKCWDNRWIVWHVIRPVVAVIMGAVSFLIVKVGFLLLLAPESGTYRYYGAYIIAFIAGLNVSNFIQRMEIMAQHWTQVKPSRMSDQSHKD